MRSSKCKKNSIVALLFPFASAGLQSFTANEGIKNYVPSVASALLFVGAVLLLAIFGFAVEKGSTLSFAVAPVVLMAIYGVFQIYRDPGIATFQLCVSDNKSLSMDSEQTKAEGDKINTISGCSDAVTATAMVLPSEMSDKVRLELHSHVVPDLQENSSVKLFQDKELREGVPSHPADDNSDDFNVESVQPLLDSEEIFSVHSDTPLCCNEGLGSPISGVPSHPADDNSDDYLRFATDPSVASNLNGHRSQCEDFNVESVQPLLDSEEIFSVHSDTPLCCNEGLGSPISESVWQSVPDKDQFAHNEETENVTNRKPHRILKNLFAETKSTLDRLKNKVFKSQEQNKLKKSRARKYYDKNNAARLPLTKHERRKSKGWVPFACCPSKKDVVP